jgi:hypothetical protein
MVMSIGIDLPTLLADEDEQICCILNDGFRVVPNAFG